MLCVAMTGVAGCAHECESATSVGVSCHTLVGFKGSSRKPGQETVAGELTDLGMNLLLLFC